MISFHYYRKKQIDLRCAKELFFGIPDLEFSNSKYLMQKVNIEISSPLTKLSQTYRHFDGTCFRLKQREWNKENSIFPAINLKIERDLEASKLLYPRDTRVRKSFLSTLANPE